VLLEGEARIGEAAEREGGAQNEDGTSYAANAHFP
jgi:hypothetical protein